MSKEQNHQFEEISKQYITEIIGAMKIPVKHIHDILKNDYISKLTSPVNPNLITTARYIFDYCDVANIDMAKPIIEKIDGVEEVTPVSIKFRPFIQKMGKIGQHYNLIIKYKGIFLGFDIASAQLGNLPVENAGGRKEDQILIFPAITKEDAMLKFQQIYGGHPELGYHLYT